jgi:fermentation-respiration switch protein FrsA (DUF1100 family)
MPEITTTPVSFIADGLELRGILRVPAPGRGPALVFTGPLTGVKEQVAGTYATTLAERGFVTLAFDHRGFGESDGHVRQHEDAGGKLADLTAAVGFLAGRDEVDADRIGCVGICMGGGYALRFSAFDPRIKALATVAGGYNSPAAMRAGMGADGYRGVLAAMAEVAGRQQRTGTIEYLPAVAAGGGEALMAGDEPFAYYGTERSRAEHWENRMTRLSLREMVTVDLALGADFISPTPWLLVHGRADAYCSPEGAAAAFARASEPKRAVWLDAGLHIDLYDNPAFVDPAIAEIEAWMSEHL